MGWQVAFAEAAATGLLDDGNLANCLVSFLSEVGAAAPGPATLRASELVQVVRNRAGHRPAMSPPRSAIRGANPGSPASVASLASTQLYPVPAEPLALLGTPMPLSPPGSAKTPTKEEKTAPAPSKRGVRPHGRRSAASPTATIGKRVTPRLSKEERRKQRVALGDVISSDDGMDDSGTEEPSVASLAGSTGVAALGFPDRADAAAAPADRDL